MKTILLVDDSRAVRLAARRMLGSRCAILEAEHGEMALATLRANPQVDAVLLDWNMPVMDGITFLRKLRSDATLPQPRVVMCTTEGELARIMDALNSGANEYIMKPFTEEIVMEKLQEVGVL